MKICSTCGIEKAETEFSWKQMNVHRSARCKQCHSRLRREHYLANQEKYQTMARVHHGSKIERQAKRHNISIKTLSSMFARYDGACWVCKTRPATSVDHDHACCSGRDGSCGKCIRGVVCSPCNTAIALLGDNEKGVAKALQYLESSARVDDSTNPALWEQASLQN